MKTKNETTNNSKPMAYDTLLAAVLILMRYLAAFALGMLPILIGLKDGWYIMPLVIFNFVAQFGLATFQMLPYFKKLKYCS